MEIGVLFEHNPNQSTVCYSEPNRTNKLNNISVKMKRNEFSARKWPLRQHENQ